MWYELYICISAYYTVQYTAQYVVGWRDLNNSASMLGRSVSSHFPSLLLLGQSDKMVENYLGRIETSEGKKLRWGDGE